MTRQALNVFFQKLKMPDQPIIKTERAGDEHCCTLSLPNVHNEKGILNGQEFKGTSFLLKGNVSEWKRACESLSLVYLRLLEAVQSYL